MSPKPRKYQRRNYYIDKSFQTKFILKFCSLLAFGSAFDRGFDLLVGAAFNDRRHCRWAGGCAYHGRISPAVTASDCFY